MRHRPWKWIGGGLVATLLGGVCYNSTAGARPGPTHQAGQHDSAATQPVTAVANALPVVVDGAKTPEQIPDSLAYHHFLIAISPASDTESAEEAARRSAMLAEVGLSDKDLALVVSRLSAIGAGLQELGSAKRRANELGALEGGESLKHQESDLVAGVRAGLQKDLSAAGTSLLDRHVTEQVKRGIVIYGAVVK